MVKYECKTCKYITNRKSSFLLHLETKKHIKAFQKNLQIKEDEINDNHIENNEINNESRCNFCHKIYANKKCLRQHLDRCKIRKEKEQKQAQKQIIQAKDDIIKEKNKVEKILIEGAKQMKDNNKKMYHMSMKNQDSFKFILEHFKDAPDAFFPDDIEEKLLENMAEYMDMDNPVAAISKAFLDFIPQQPQEKRFIHGIDISRVKYVVKKDGKWNVDYYAKDVIPKFVYHFKKSCGKFVEGEMKRIEGPKIYDRIAFLDKLDSKILSNKVARNVSHDLQLNKVTYLRRMIAMQKT